MSRVAHGPSDAAQLPAWRLAAWRHRLRQWWYARLPFSDTHTLTQGNVYIIPTRAGLMFAVTVLVLLIASINYQLNLGFVLTFMLAGSGLVSMHLTHGNLRALQMHLRPVAPAFTADVATLEVVLASPTHARYGIGLRVNDGGERSRARHSWAWCDVPAGGQCTVQVGFVAPQRGRHRLPMLVAETHFPLGLFRAWTVWRPASTILCYPRPERPALALPPARAVPGGPTRRFEADGDAIEGVRTYRRGDSLKRIVWKKAARSLEAGGDLVSLDTSASAQYELWLDDQACGAAGAEARLSRLAAWVVAADARGIDYGLRLGGIETPPAHGDAQRRRCLERLALWN